MSYKCNKCVGTDVSFQRWPQWSKGGSCLVSNNLGYCIVGYSMVAKLSRTVPGATSLMTWSFDCILTSPWGQTLRHHIFLTALVFMQREAVLCSLCGCIPLTLPTGSLGPTSAHASADTWHCIPGERQYLHCIWIQLSGFVNKVSVGYAYKGFSKKSSLDKILLSQFFPFFSALSLPSKAQSVLSVLSCTVCSLDMMLAGLFLSILGNDRVFLWFVFDCSSGAKQYA